MQIPLRVILFGPARIQSGSDLIRLSTKQASLVARVVTSDHLRLPRERLARLLWPRSDERRARHSLSQALYEINQKTDHQGLEVTSTEVSAGRIASDVRDFLLAYRYGHWEAAAAVYQGVFLESINLPECPEMMLWIECQRRKFGELARSVMVELLSGSQREVAEELLQALLKGGVQDEELRELSATLRSPANGQQSSGSAVLAKSVNQSAAFTWPSTTALPSKFVGRVAEMQALEALVQDETGASTKVMIIITGEPGVGKSALAERFVRKRVLRGDLALIAKGRQIEKNVPFGIIDQLIDGIPERERSNYKNEPWWPALDTIFADDPELRGDVLSTSILHRRVLEGLRRLMSSLAANRRLFLLIDDIEWGDVASITFLRYLMSRGGTGSIFCVTTCTDQNSPKILSLSRGEITMSVLELEGLDRGEIEQLLNTRGSQVAADRALLTELTDRSGGNPLFLSFLLETEISSGDAVSASISDHFEPRLLALLSEERAALAALAIANEPISQEAMGDILGLPNQAVSRAVAKLDSLKLVRQDTTGVYLRHKLVGEIALSMVPNIENRRLYGRTLRFISKSHNFRSAVSAVSHDILGDREAAYHAARQAADACEVLSAHEERLYFLKLAASNATAQKDAIESRIALSDVLLKLQSPEEALRAINFDDLSVPRHQERSIDLQRIRISLALATTTTQLQECWDQLTDLGLEEPYDELAAIYGELISVANDLGMGAMLTEARRRLKQILKPLPVEEKWLPLLRLVLLDAVSADSTAALQELEALEPWGSLSIGSYCHYLTVRGSLHVSAGKLVEAEKDFVEALYVAERHALYDQLFQIHNNLGVCLLERGKFEAAEDQFVQAQACAPEESYRSLDALAADNLVITSYERGNYEQAVKLASLSICIPNKGGIRSLLSNLAVTGLCHLKLGRLSEAREVQRELAMRQTEGTALFGDFSYMYIFRARMLSLVEQYESALQSLDAASAHYRQCLATSRWRIELEASRLAHQLGLSDAHERIEQLRVELENSGADTIVERVSQLGRRASLG